MHIAAFFVIVLALGLARHVTPQALARLAPFAAILVALLGIGIAHGESFNPKFDGNAWFWLILWTSAGTWAFLRGLAWVFGARFGDLD